MGGHGALTIGLKHPDLFKSISAFSPISNPISVPWARRPSQATLAMTRNPGGSMTPQSW